MDKSVRYFQFDDAQADALFDALAPEAYNRDRSDTHGGPGNWLFWGTNKSLLIAAGPSDTEPFKYLKIFLTGLYPEKPITFQYLDRDNLA